MGNIQARRKITAPAQPLATLHIHFPISCLNTMLHNIALVSVQIQREHCLPSFVFFHLSSFMISIRRTASTFYLPSFVPLRDLHSGLLLTAFASSFWCCCIFDSLNCVRHQSIELYQLTINATDESQYKSTTQAVPSSKLNQDSSCLLQVLFNTLSFWLFRTISRGDFHNSFASIDCGLLIFAKCLKLLSFELEGST